MDLRHLDSSHSPAGHGDVQKQASSQARGAGAIAAAAAAAPAAAFASQSLWLADGRRT
jgi:hypothetical protein